MNQSEADVQEEVFAEATRIGRDLIRGLLPTPEAKRSWTPGPFDAVDAGGVESISGSPGTPPHEDETPLAPEDAVKMELAAAIFGESGLEVDIERLGRADGQYDALLVTGWNWPRAVAGRGSAIFVHIRRGPQHPTAGCVGLARADLLWIARRLRPWSRLVVRGARPQP